MEALLERIIGRYGTEMIWKSDGCERVIRGFFQPMTARSWQIMRREMAPLGEVSEGLYIYIGTMSNEIAATDRLTLGRREYEIRRTETIYDSHGGAYRWGLCIRKGE